MQGGVGTLVAGRYLLAEAVGQGGMGRVWRGRDQLLDRVVAVKEVILPSQSPEERAELLARTMREARAAARLDHPGVVTIHDVVEHEGSPWIVMQFVAGTSLRARIESEGHLPWQEVADIGGQVAEALAVAHAAGIVHRDLKPDNILLSGGRAIVTDFGIARIMDSTTQLTSTGVLVGTPAYMAPEQLDGGEAGPAVDLWALGATLYTAAEGTPPFASATMSSLIAAILTKMPPRPRHAGPFLEEVLAGLLAKDPARRPDAVAAARALAACRAGEAVRDPAASLRPSPTAAVGGPASPFLGTVTGGGRPPEASGESAAITPPPGAASHPSFPGMHWPSASRTESAFIPQPPSSLVPVRKRRWRLPVTILSAAVVLAAVAGGGAALLTRGNHSPGIVASSTRSPASQHVSAPAPSRTPTGQRASRSTSTGPVTTSLLATLTDPNGQSPNSVALGTAGILAVGDGNGGTYVWNTGTKSLIATPTAPDGGRAAPVAFGPDGILALSDGNTGISLWDSSTRSVVARLADPDGLPPQSLAFAADGTLAVEDASSSVYLWDTATRTLITALAEPDGFPKAVEAFGPDDLLAVSGDRSNAPDPDINTYLWDTKTGSTSGSLADPGGNRVDALALGPDGTLAIGDKFANNGGSTYLWDASTRRITGALTDPGSQGVESVAFGPDGLLAVGDDNGHVYLWDTATRKIAATLTDPGGHGPNGQGVYCLAFGSDGTLAVGDLNGHVYLWRISSGKS